MSSTTAQQAVARVERGMLARHVYEQLRHQIIRGVFAPGARVVEAEVAERFGVGRTPVREALQLLLQEHYLSARDGLGRRQLVVAPLRTDDVDELFGIIADLECSAVRHLEELDAAEREKLARKLAAANAVFGRTSRRRPLDLEKVFDAHRAFHMTLTNPLAGPRLAALLSHVRAQLERYEWSYALLVERELESAVDEHEDIIAAVSSGTVASVERALRRNWQHASERLRSVIAGVGERGSW